MPRGKVSGKMELLDGNGRGLLLMGVQSDEVCIIWSLCSCGLCVDLLVGGFMFVEGSWFIIRFYLWLEVYV